jgi:hypothetical protein
MTASRFASVFIHYSILLTMVVGLPSHAQAENCFTRFFDLFSIPHEENLAQDWMVKPFRKIRIDDQIQLTSPQGTLTGKVEELNFKNISVRTSKSLVTLPLKDLKDFEVLTHGGNRIDDSLQKARLKAIANSIAMRSDDLYSSAQVAEEMKHFRALPKNQKEAYLRAAGDKVMSQIMSKHHTRRIGFHYNLHGGVLGDYIDRGGIQATYGDIALQHGSGDARLKVYYFDSDHFGLYDILNERHPDFLMKKTRMGNILTPFNLESNYFKEARARGGIVDENSISTTFDDTWVKNTPMSKHVKSTIGVPVTEYLDTPMEIFRPLKDYKKLELNTHPYWDEAGSLSWDEMTLLQIRHLQHRLVDRFQKDAH